MIEDMGIERLYESEPFYSDPAREDVDTALPDCEVFQQTDGWYWWPCMPGSIPDGEPVGPFEGKAQAIEDARNY